ncbi:uncharacterized protein LOC106639963 [Copidosoma floridanum]|uniref:uncharacterized protein LOC106639963 n=1 Tax=Copidosoma floridanum TaxID=29053 RepID=UPI0006C98C96|nr:uncharacterized protein LOC106639963 [Copidosoma floridanum]
MAAGGLCSIHLKKSFILQNYNTGVQLPRAIFYTYAVPLKILSQEIKNLTLKQNSCILKMQHENGKINSTQENAELQCLFSTIKIYSYKLSMIKKELLLIHGKVLKLRKTMLLNFNRC